MVSMHAVLLAQNRDFNVVSRMKYVFSRTSAKDSRICRSVRGA